MIDDHYGDKHIGHDLGKESTGSLLKSASVPHKYDVHYHGGFDLERHIAHEYDEIFHEMVQKAPHSIEHHDLHYSKVHPSLTYSDVHVEDPHAMKPKSTHLEPVSYGQHAPVTHVTKDDDKAD